MFKRLFRFISYITVITIIDLLWRIFETCEKWQRNLDTVKEALETHAFRLNYSESDLRDKMFPNMVNVPTFQDAWRWLWYGNELKE